MWPIFVAKGFPKAINESLYPTNVSELKFYFDEKFHLSTDCTLNIGAVDGRGLVERRKAGTIIFTTQR